MLEYTRKDIIMDPNDPRLDGAIGKKVYCSSDINLLLHRANNDKYEMTLTQVEDVDSEPFTVVDMDGDGIDAEFIIIKKEEPKPKYFPFENAEQFLDAYYHNETNKLDGVYHYLATRGIWIKGKGECTSYYMVTEIWDDGVIIGDSKINTTQVSSDRYFTANDTTEWEELFNNYTFLDGSPCGKEVK